MPFKRKGRTIYVLKKGRWRVHERCKSVKKAKSLFKFLVAKYSAEQEAYRKRK